MRKDHYALQWLCSFKEPEGQVEHLEEYHFKVLHRPGKKHGNADPLFRYPYHQCGNQPVVVDAIADQRGSVGQCSRQSKRLSISRMMTLTMIRWMK